MMHYGPDWWVVVAVVFWVGLLAIVTAIWVRREW
jgi:hypothetical protein